MKRCRIHITGASGSGATSLGRALADALAIPHHDTDDYFWQPTVPPYQNKRDIAERLRLTREIFLPRADWVLSGSLEGWGNPIVPHFDLVVFLTTPTALRMQRLRAREATHFGADAVAPAAGATRRAKNSSNGRRTMMMAAARAAIWRDMRRGSPPCPALCCVSTDHDHCPSWSRRFVARSPVEQ